MANHQRCIGLQKIPKEEWVCNGCKAYGEKSKYLRCYLCPIRGGAFYQTKLSSQSEYIKNKFSKYYEAMKEKKVTDCDFYQKNIQLIKEEPKKYLKEKLNDLEQRFLKYSKNDKQQEVRLLFKSFNEPIFFDDEIQDMNEPKSEFAWMHYSCGFWHGINYNLGIFQNPEKKYYTSQIGKKCSICQKIEGGCIKCQEPNCSQIFHVECARIIKYEMIETDEKPQCKIYCPEHTKLQLELRIDYQTKQIIRQLINYKIHIQKTFPNIHIRSEHSKGNSKKLNISPQQNRISQSFKNKFLFLKQKERRFLFQIFTQIKQYHGWSTVIHLKKKNEIYELEQLEKSSKDISTDKIDQQHEIWKILKKKYKKSDNLYDQYVKLLNKIKHKKVNDKQIKKILQKTLKNKILTNHDNTHYSNFNDSNLDHKYNNYEFKVLSDNEFEMTRIEKSQINKQNNNSHSNSHSQNDNSVLSIQQKVQNDQEKKSCKTNQILLSIQFNQNTSFFFQLYQINFINN